MLYAECFASGRSRPDAGHVAAVAAVVLRVGECAAGGGPHRALARLLISARWVILSRWRWAISIVMAGLIWRWQITPLTTSRCCSTPAMPARAAGRALRRRPNDAQRLPGECADHGQRNSGAEHDRADTDERLSVTPKHQALCTGLIPAALVHDP